MFSYPYDKYQLEHPFLCNLNKIFPNIQFGCSEPFPRWPIVSEGLTLFCLLWPWTLHPMVLSSVNCFHLSLFLSFYKTSFTWSFSEKTSKIYILDTPVPLKVPFLTLSITRDFPPAFHLLSNPDHLFFPLFHTGANINSSHVFMQSSFSYFARAHTHVFRVSPYARTVYQGIFPNIVFFFPPKNYSDTIYY